MVVGFRYVGVGCGGENDNNFVLILHTLFFLNSDNCCILLLQMLHWSVYTLFVFGLKLMGLEMTVLVLTVMMTVVMTMAIHLYLLLFQSLLIVVFFAAAVAPLAVGALLGFIAWVRGLKGSYCKQAMAMKAAATSITCLATVCIQLWLIVVFEATAAPIAFDASCGMGWRVGLIFIVWQW